MSGGHFDYQQYRIRDIADSIQEEIEDNDKPWFPEDSPYAWDQECNKEFFESGGKRYSDETIKEFKAAIWHLRIAEIYAQRIDWLLSGDDGEEEFHKRLNAELEELEHEFRKV